MERAFSRQKSTLITSPLASGAAIHVLSSDEDPRPPELPRKVLIWWHPLVACTAIILLYIYTVVRVYCLLTSDNSTMLMWAFLLAEWGIADPSITAQRLTIRAGSAARRRARRPLLRLLGSELPTVDVLVVCCGENIEIIMDTIKAACALDYPQHCFHVLVLDDGNSGELRRAVMELRVQYPNLHYSARPKRPSFAFSKAGNINHALREIHDVQWPGPELIAVFDADFIAEPSFLRATVPHLTQNPKIGMVSTPQHFYNLPDGDPILQALDYGTSILEPLQDRQGTATCSGSGFVVRRGAVLQFGGFPTFSFNEDVLLSLLLAQAGWQIIHLQEPLQFGLVPGSLEAHISQRQRWSIGVSQLVGVLSPSIYLPITFSQRIAFAQEGFLFACHLMWCSFSLVMVPLALFAGTSLVAYSSIRQLQLLLGLAISYHATAWTHEFLTAASSSYFITAFPHLNQVWIAPLQIPALFRFCVYRLVGQNKAAMPKPTGTQKFFNPASTGEYSGWQRLRHSCWDCGIIFHFGLFVLTLASMVFSAWQSCDISSFLPRMPSERCLTRIAWPPALHLCYIVVTQRWVPMAEVISPTPRPRRESLLVRDPVSRAAYPSRQARAVALNRTKQRLGRFNHYILIPASLLLAAMATLSL